MYFSPIKKPQLFKYEGSSLNRVDSSRFRITSE